MADFRDPWTTIDYLKDLPLTQRSRRKHAVLEKQVLDRSDQVIVIGNGMQEEFTHKTNTPVAVIPNGYDPEDFAAVPPPPAAQSHFSIVHVGMINKDRSHAIFYEAIAELLEEIPAFQDHLKIRFAGKLDHFRAPATRSPPPERLRRVQLLT